MSSFNQDHYNKRLAELKAEVEADEDPAWRRTLDQRFADFTLKQAMQRLAVAVDMMEKDRQRVTLDPFQFVNYVCGELSQISGTIVESVTLIAGRTTLRDPVAIEAQLRLYKELGGF